MSGGGVVRGYNRRLCRPLDVYCQNLLTDPYFPRSVPAADPETDSSASEKAPHSFHGYPKAQFFRPPVKI